MPHLNKKILVGNLTKDPELKYTPSGQPVSTIRVATNRTWITKTGEKKSEAEYHSVVLWGKLAESVSKNLSKGRKILVEGRLRTRNWQAPDGTKRYATEIVAENIRFLDRGPARETNSQQVPPEDPAQEKPSIVEEIGEINVEDLPF